MTVSWLPFIAQCHNMIIVNQGSAEATDGIGSGTRLDLLFFAPTAFQPLTEEVTLQMPSGRGCDGGRAQRCEHWASRSTGEHCEVRGRVTRHASAALRTRRSIVSTPRAWTSAVVYSPASSFSIPSVKPDCERSESAVAQSNWFIRCLGLVGSIVASRCESWQAFTDDPIGLGLSNAIGFDQRIWAWWWRHAVHCEATRFVATSKLCQRCWNREDRRYEDYCVRDWLPGNNPRCLHG